MDDEARVVILRATPCDSAIAARSKSARPSDLLHQRTYGSAGPPACFVGRPAGRRPRASLPAL